MTDAGLLPPTMEPSCVAGIVALTDQLGCLVGGTLHPAVGIEVQALPRAVGGELVRIEVHTDHGVTEATELFLVLQSHVEDLLVAHRELVGIAIGNGARPVGLAA